MKKHFILNKILFLTIFLVILSSCKINNNSTIESKNDKKGTSKLLNDAKFCESLHVIRNETTNTEAVVRGDGTMIFNSMRPEHEYFRICVDNITKEPSYIFRMEQGDSLEEVYYGDPGETRSYSEPSFRGSFYTTNGEYTGLSAGTYGADLVIGDNIIYKDETERGDANRLYIYNVKTKEKTKAPQSEVYYFNSHIIFSVNPYSVYLENPDGDDVIICDNDLNVVKTIDNCGISDTIRNDEVELCLVAINEIVNKDKNEKDLVYNTDYIRRYNYLDKDFNFIFDEPVDNRVDLTNGTIATVHRDDIEYDFDFKKMERVSDVRPYSGADTYNDRYYLDREKYSEKSESIKSKDSKYAYVETRIYKDKVLFFAYYDGDYDVTTDNFIIPCDIYSEDGELLLKVKNLNVTYEDDGFFLTDYRTIYNFDMEKVKEFDRDTYLNSFTLGDRRFYQSSQNSSYNEYDHFSVFDNSLNEIFTNVRRTITYTYDDCLIIVYDDKTEILDKDLKLIKSFDRSLDIRNWYSDKELEYRAFTDINTNRMGIIDGKYNVIVDNLKAVSGLEELCFSYTNGFRYGLMDYNGDVICSFSIFNTMKEDAKMSDYDIRFIE